MKKCICFLLLLLHGYAIQASNPAELTYFLPDIPYREDLLSPADYFGVEMGAWHLGYDQMLAYYKYLAEKSPRVQVKEYARSYENRPLVLLQISSEENIGRLEEIRENHLAGIKKGQFNSDKIILYQSYSVHGNEASACHAALLVAYYLAAGESEEVQNMRSQMVFLLDPCLNPDGYQRFSTWVNMHKNKNLSTDPNDREFSEYWPGGRTNHYWFDLNRDYLMVQHPESKGRVRVFHDWKPHVYTDFHEMYPNATYFFMPGVPSRTHPLTLASNQTLTEKIALYHAKALDSLGALYYTKEDFDDFYLGKGSTFPDVNGSIGILFEQASSRGHGQQTVHGLLTFAFTIRNQVATSLSSQKASYELRNSLLDFQKEFYKSRKEENQKNKGGYLLTLDQDRGKLEHLTQILDLHQIEYQLLSQHAQALPDRMYLPFDQYQYFLLRGMFDRQLSFTDSVFYDVSTWTLSEAFGYSLRLSQPKEFANLEGSTALPPFTPTPADAKGCYGFLLPWEDYNAPAVLNQLLENNLLCRVAREPFQIHQRNHARGTIWIPTALQPMEYPQLMALMNSLSEQYKVSLIPVYSGLSEAGPSLGSAQFQPLTKKNIALVVGTGISASSAGEVWHQLDQRYDMVLTKLEAQTFAFKDLTSYNVLILPEGNYSAWGNKEAEALQNWLQTEGNTLLALGSASLWTAKNQLSGPTLKSLSTAQKSKTGQAQRYSDYFEERGSKALGGIIVSCLIDNSHPLFYGYPSSHVKAFRRGTQFWEPHANPLATPMVYDKNPLVSGYMHPDYQGVIDQSAGALVYTKGKGRVIHLADNPLFRAYWFHSNKILANALFFGSIIHPGTTARN
jgi:hypothetical protein